MYTSNTYLPVLANIIADDVIPITIADLYFALNYFFDVQSQLHYIFIYIVVLISLHTLAAFFQRI